MMKKQLLILLVIFFIGCSRNLAPERVLYLENGIKAENIQIPDILNPGDEGYFSVETTEDNICHAEIRYVDEAQDLVTVELPSMKADKNGICEWLWMMPEEVSSSLGEFRLNINDDRNIRYLPPLTFCIRGCS
jgi:hypothetical protein